MGEEVVLSEHVSWHHASGQVLTSVLSWKNGNPLEVSVGFTGAPAWVFARDILQDAVEGVMSGAGDVKAWRYDGFLYLHFDAPGGSLTAYTKAETVARFLARTYDEVPRGSEEYDLDSWGFPE